jgi:hypothetical protein
MTSLNKILIISFIFLINGCMCPKEHMEWQMPRAPIQMHVEFKEKNSELFLDKTNSVNLLYNINEMEAYQKNLKLLVEKMKNYYDAK